MTEGSTCMYMYTELHSEMEKTMVLFVCVPLATKTQQAGWMEIMHYIIKGGNTTL